MIYDYLFYKSAQVYRQLSNKIELSLFEGLIWILPCFAFNIFTVVVLVELILNVDSGFASFISSYKYYIAISLMGVFIFYYWYKARWRKVLTKYTEKERLAGKSADPLMVVALWYFISFFLLMLVSMYKRGDGIFS